MWLLRPPSVSKVADHLDMALKLSSTSPVYALSKVEQRAILKVYKAYDALGGQPHVKLKPAALNAAMPSLKNAYGEVQIGGRLAKLRDEIKADLAECPLCGYGDPVTLDHYLPRSSFKALAIYPRNLISACQPCNRKKGVSVPAGAAGFIHPYFDPLRKLPKTSFLHAAVTFDAGRLTVKFRIQHPTLDAQTQARLRHQLAKLELDRRYVAPTNVFLFSHKDSLLAFKGAEAANLRSLYLASAAKRWARDFGGNDWRTALLRGLSNCPDFCADPKPYYRRRLGRKARALLV